MKKTRRLSESNVKISPIVLGTWAIGGWLWGGSDEKDSIAAIQTSIDHGINTLDTAAVYGMGRSEEIIAKAIKGRREEVVIATKCGMRWDSSEGSDPWLSQNNQGKQVIIRKNSKPSSIIFECEQSLKRLEIDMIDLYQIHWPDSTTSIEESWEAMVSLKEQGKVRAIGVSNYNLEQLKRAHEIHRVDSIQPPYSLIRRGIEQDILPYCQENHIGVIVYSPLERGLLTGKVTLDRQFPEGDHRLLNPLFSLENRQSILEALEELRSIAERHQATISEVIINTTIQMPGITAAIVGARNASQAAENARALKLKLSKEEMDLVIAILERAHSACGIDDKK